LRFLINLDLLLIRFPEADDPNSIHDRCKADEMHARPDQSDRDHPTLRIGEASIFRIDGRFPSELLREFERQSALSRVLSAFTGSNSIFI
jgi:hypothetical protein